VPCAPCEASELVHFRKRIGAKGIELIFKESVRLNGEDAKEESIKADTAVQEKNITFPTDAKLHRKIIEKCQAIRKKEGLPVRQSYTRTLKDLDMDQRFRSHPKNKGGTCLREAFTKKTLPYFSKCRSKTSKHKIYSLHEPEVKCIAKGKAHKKYEFGNKASISVTENTGVIVGALSFRNSYYCNTLNEVIKQYESIFGKAPRHLTVDRGYPGKNK